MTHFQPLHELQQDQAAFKARSAERRVTVASLRHRFQSNELGARRFNHEYRIILAAQQLDERTTGFKERAFL